LNVNKYLYLPEGIIFFLEGEKEENYDDESKGETEHEKESFGG